jgi:peptidoglycan/xylan/chitin deacetylase (PgdA/CDA1 family)
MSDSRLRVLTYHRVLDPAQTPTLNASVISATPAAFTRQMRHLAAHYRVLPAEEVVDAVRARRRLPPRAVLLTFDDGYRDFGEVAWPVLRRYRLPATLFVPTHYPDQPERVFWWDHLDRAFALTARTWISVPPLGILSLRGVAARRRSLRRVQQHLKGVPHAELTTVVRAISGQLDDVRRTPSDVLSWPELVALSRDGVTLAPHTRTHPALTQMPEGEARAEIRGSREDLRRRIGTVPPIFAYPFGAHDDRVIDIVREEGFELAVTTVPGHNLLSRIDPLQLRRTNVGMRTGPFLFPLRLLNAFTAIDRWRQGIRRGADWEPLVRGLA